jgi:acyl-CoA thioesterase FadM
MDSFYCLEDVHTGEVLAEGSSVLVAYNYHTGRSIAISEEWRTIISEFENI